MTVRRYFIILSVLLISLTVIAGIHNPHFFYFFLLLAPVVALGLSNIFQHRINILRNFPVIGALRYFLLSIRPQIRQYFVESDTEATPYSHEERQLVYNRAKRENDNLPFGTLKDVYKNNYEWLTHSLQPKSIPHHEMKVVFGGDDCKQPYTCSRLNVSAMSFGALGRKAVMALNKGAKLGGFAQNTGEGGLTPYHLKYGGDLIMQLGSGYFGCREKKSGKFAPELFKEKAARYRKHLGVKYTLLFGGLAEKSYVATQFPMVNKIFAYPTTITFDRKGQIRNIHAGFAGPSTGQVYLDHLAKTDSMIRSLLAE